MDPARDLDRNFVAWVTPAPVEYSMNGYNFTHSVRKVLQMAREEAASLGQPYVGTEHVLLGMIRDDECVATAVLKALEVDLGHIRQKIEDTVRQRGKGGRAMRRGDLDLPYTSRAKKVLELAMMEARELNYRNIDTGILFLGLLREEKGIAAQVLTDAGVTLERARAEALRLAEREPLSKPEAATSRAGRYNFTDRVRQILQLAREEAARLGHEYVGTEHILLGLVREGEGVAAAVLTNLNVDLEAIALVIENRVVKGKGGRAPGPDFPYTVSAKRVLELAMTETHDLNHSYVGSEHLLLGLLREGKGLAAEVLTDAGVTLEQARAETLRLLGSEMPAEPPEQGRRAVLLTRMRELVGELLGSAAPDAARLIAIATELRSLLDELAGMR